MENKNEENLNIKKESLNESLNESSMSSSDISKAIESDKKSKKPLIIFGILAVIAILIVAFIFKGLNKTDIIKNDEVPSEAEEIQVGLTDYSASKSELKELEDLNETIEAYVNQVYDERGIASVYAMLFSIEDNTTIAMKDLMSDGVVTASDNVANNTDILYIKGTDVGLNNDDFKVITAFNTKDGFYLSGKDIEGKYYSEQEYHDLVFKYSFNHGELINPKAGEDNYTKILTAAAVNNNYDIKHLVCDDKYAVVVANNLNNTAEFIEAVLVKDGENWTVGIGNLVNAKNAKQVVNKNYPDMELGLMPIYNIGDYTNIMADLSSSVKQLVDLKFITSEEASSAYVCGAGSFAYIQTESGRRILGCMSDKDKLDFNEYKSLEETIAAMVTLQEDPPVFIIKFN